MPVTTNPPGATPSRDERKSDERKKAATPRRGPARVIPVGGGKGGVGKTFLVANLAACMAREGYRVVAVDGDLAKIHALAQQSDL